MGNSTAWRFRLWAAVVATAGVAALAGGLLARVGTGLGAAWLAALVAGVLGAIWVDKLTQAWRLRDEARRQVLEQVLDELRSRATAVTLAAGMIRQRRGRGPEPDPRAGGARVRERPASPVPWSRPAGGGGGAAAGPVAAQAALATGPAARPGAGGGVGPASSRGDIGPAVSPRVPRPPLGPPFAGRPAAGTQFPSTTEPAAPPAPKPSPLPSPSPGEWPAVVAAASRPLVLALRDETRLEGQALATLEAEAELLRVGALQLATWLRFDAGRVRGERERIDLAALAERCARRLAVTALARQVQLCFAGTPGPAVVVRGDRALLELLCLTLVAAAVDRALPGSRVQVEVWGDGGAVTLGVTGEAAGWRRGGPGGRRRPGDGPDLRVELARRIARLHGGRWQAAPGQPWQWQVVLPAAHGPFTGRVWGAGGEWSPRGRGILAEPDGAAAARTASRPGRFAPAGTARFRQGSP